MLHFATLFGFIFRHASSLCCVRGQLINFIGKFDMDEVNTDLTLASTEYDPSPSAEYGSWLLLEKESE